MTEPVYEVELHHTQGIGWSYRLYCDDERIAEVHSTTWSYETALAKAKETAVRHRDMTRPSRIKLDLGPR